MNGMNGMNGVDGVDGSDGVVGVVGVVGSDGVDGVVGSDGVDGVVGSDGVDGKGTSHPIKPPVLVTRIARAPVLVVSRTEQGIPASLRSASPSFGAVARTPLPPIAGQVLILLWPARAPF